MRLFRGALLQCRSTPEAFFDVHPTTWYRTEISLTTLAELIPIDQWGPFRCDSLRELAVTLPHLQRSKPLGGDLQHCLIIVSESQNGKLLLLDGYRRAACLLRAKQARFVPVHWGICAELSDWDYYRSG